MAMFSRLQLPGGLRVLLSSSVPQFHSYTPSRIPFTRWQTSRSSAPHSLKVLHATCGRPAPHVLWAYGSERQHSGDITRNFTTQKSGQDLEKMTVVQLKERLKEIGGKVSGRKADLILRLRDLQSKADDFLADDHFTSKKKVGGQSYGSDDQRNELPAPASADGHLETSIFGGEKEGAPVSRKPKKPKPKKELPQQLSKALRQKVQHASVLKLYKECLRCAERCPTESWALSMKAYVRGKFRDPTVRDDIAVRLAHGQQELDNMNSYHAAREARQTEGEQVI